MLSGEDDHPPETEVQREIVAAVIVLPRQVTGTEPETPHRSLWDANVESATGTLPVPMTSCVVLAVTDMVTPSVDVVPVGTEATSE